MIGWSQIILGAFFLIGGLVTLFDPSARRIKIGAIIVGPLIIYRGIRSLNEDREVKRGPNSNVVESLHLPAYDDVRSPHEKPASAPEPKEIAELAADVRAHTVHVDCQACYKPYVYFPETSDEAHLQYQQLGHCAAPCPRCGWFQSNMLDLSSEFRSSAHWTEKYAMIAGFLLLASAGFLAFNLNKFYGGHVRIDPLERYYWFANLAVLLAALACGVVFLKGCYRVPNPNDAPIEMRLRRGKRLGMPLEDFESSAQQPQPNDTSSSTGIMEVKG